MEACSNNKIVAWNEILDKPIILYRRSIFFFIYNMFGEHFNECFALSHPFYFLC